jgi:hypothetical protein
MDDYVSFDNEWNHAVLILDKNNKEISMEIFVSKEKASKFIGKYNSN